MAFIEFDGGYYEGETKFGVPDGEGEAHYKNGNAYYGEWSDGKFYGKGKFIDHCGSRYEGEFLNNKMYGKGTLYYANGDRYEGVFESGHIVSGTVYYNDGYKYIGTFDEQEREHGEGEMFYPNGSRYKGQWQHGKTHGKGTVYYANGDVIEGILQNGSFVKGVCCYKDGKRYSGEVEEIGGKILLNGNGEMYFPNGDCYKGQWLHDNANGEGTHYYAIGVTKRGTFKDGKEDGVFVYDYPFLKIKGKSEFKDGKQISNPTYFDYDGKPIDAKSICLNHNNSTYIGGIKDGKMHGKGILWVNDGRRFVGEFENNLVHGNGTIYYKNGNRFEGTWNHGTLYGKGVRYYSGGTKSLVEFQNGEEILLAGPVKIDEDFPAQNKSLKGDDKKSSVTKSKPNSNKKRVVKTKGESVIGAQTIEYPDGRKYIGEIKKGKRHGIGTIYYTDGSYYDGEWRKDNMHGEGIMYFTENTTYCNADGSEIKVKAGSRIKGVWKNSDNGKRLTLILPGGTRKEIRLVRGNFILK